MEMKLAFAKLIILLCLWSTHGIIENVFANDLNSNPSDLKYYFFYGPKFSDHHIFYSNQTNDLLNYEHFNPSLKIVFYIFGWTETPFSNSVKEIVNAYHQRIQKDWNVIVFDWSSISKLDYLQIFPYFEKIGKAGAEFLIKLINNGYNKDNIHIVGHSMGGQLAGEIGRAIINSSKQTLKIQRITALDPAFFGFYLIPFSIQPISSSDAEFVDIIHTDVIYGAPFSTGTVDFWPNGPTNLQPGCPPRTLNPNNIPDFCSHWRSWQYWVESVANSSENDFLAFKLADSWLNVLIGSPNRNNIIKMGIDCPSNATGNYFLRTHNKSPYALGYKGIYGIQGARTHRSIGFNINKIL